MKSLLKKIFGNSTNKLEQNNPLKQVEIVSEEDTVKDKQAERRAKEDTIKYVFNNSGEVEIRIDVPSKKDYIAVINKDEFDGKVSIKFKQVANLLKDKLFTWADDGFCPLEIGFRHENSRHILAIATYQKELKLKQDDEINFLFANQEILKFKLIEKGIKVDRDDEGIITESRITINESELEIFVEQRLSKWQFISYETKTKRNGTLSLDVQEDLNEFAMAYQVVYERIIKN